MARTSIVLDDRVCKYVLACEPSEHEALRALRQATEQMPRAFMQIPPEQGHFLAFLVRLIAARRTLEIGTFTGYSALAVALALPAAGRVLTCDVNEEWAAIGREFWRKAGVAEKIETRIGVALDTLMGLERAGGSDNFDFVFIDADKVAYDQYYECALRLVRPGGLIVLDNVLWHGRVADEGASGVDIIALRALNAKIAADERVDRVVLTVCDGMTLVRRRN